MDKDVFLKTGRRVVLREAQALHLLADVSDEARITCLFVVDPDTSRNAVGILHVHDCLRAGIG